MRFCNIFNWIIPKMIDQNKWTIIVSMMFGLKPKYPIILATIFCSMFSVNLVNCHDMQVIPFLLF